MRPLREQSFRKVADVALEFDAACLHWAGHSASTLSPSQGNEANKTPPNKTADGALKDGKEPKSGIVPRPDFALTSISLSARRGRLIAVSGPVGCGKSALLQAVLGELELASGAMRKTDSPIAYYPQGGWITPGSLRYNITMREAAAGRGSEGAGRGSEEAALDEVISACALEADLARFGSGKEQELGEKGVNLSGGQQARVSLARACYVDGCVLALLDDPLAAGVPTHLLAPTLVMLSPHDDVRARVQLMRTWRRGCWNTLSSAASCAVGRPPSSL